MKVDKGTYHINSVLSRNYGKNKVANSQCLEQNNFPTIVQQNQTGKRGKTKP